MSEKTAIAKFKKRIAMRDALVAEGLEGFPVRLYKINLSVSENRKKNNFEIYTVGGLLSVEADKNFLESEIKSIWKTVRLFKPKYKLENVDIRLFKEA